MRIHILGLCLVKEVWLQGGVAGVQSGLRMGSVQGLLGSRTSVLSAALSPSPRLVTGTQ